MLVLLLLFVCLDCYNRELKIGLFKIEIYCFMILEIWKFDTLVGLRFFEVFFFVVYDYFFLCL